MSAQTTGSVKGVCKDADGNPIVQARSGVDCRAKPATSTRSRPIRKASTSRSASVPGKYNVVLKKDGKEIFHINGITVGLDETTQDIDLKKEQATAAQGQGLTPEQAKARQEAAAKAAADKKDGGHAERKTQSRPDG